MRRVGCAGDAIFHSGLRRLLTIPAVGGGRESKMWKRMKLGRWKEGEEEEDADIWGPLNLIVL